MGLFSLEQSKLAYRADFVLYGAAVASLAFFLAVATPSTLRLSCAALVLLGFGVWNGAEYALHRVVLHGLPPFRNWHAQHHQRPAALIGAPTILSATLIAVLIFLPALALGNVWHACALGLGVLCGYLTYIVTHHAIHHWRSDNSWLKRRKQWHALHHHGERAVCYGVSSSFWDHVFGTASSGRVHPRGLDIDKQQGHALVETDNPASPPPATAPAQWSASPIAQHQWLAMRYAEPPSFADTEATWRSGLFDDDIRGEPALRQTDLEPLQTDALEASNRRPQLMGLLSLRSAGKRGFTRPCGPTASLDEI